MPVLKWRGVDDTDSAAKVVGPRMRQLREARGLTIRQLAARVGVSKNTILRLEQGFPVTQAILYRVCGELRTAVPSMLARYAEASSDVSIFRAEDEVWRVAFRRSKAPSQLKDHDIIKEESERRRLGSVGFVSGFIMNHESTLRYGNLQAAIVEVYGDQEVPDYQHSGEEYVYVISGRLRLTLNGKSHVLEPGDSATFWATSPHKYESDFPLNSRQGTRFLMIWNESSEQPKSNGDRSSSSAPKHLDLKRPVEIS